MRIGLSEISTPTASFAEDVAAYAGAGLDAIGIWELGLPPDDGANRRLLREAGLAVANCVPAVPSVLPLAIPGMEGPSDPDARVDALCGSIRRLAAYEPESVLFLSGPVGETRSPVEARRVVVEATRRLAAVAREAGVRLALEPVHPSQRETAGFVTSLGEADALLRDADADDVGILLDTYHVCDDRSVLAWIAANAKRVRGVHVSDWPEPGGSGRVLPGEGASRSAELVRALAAAGWDGTLDVEIFSTPDGFWGLPADEAARRARAAAAALLS